MSPQLVWFGAKALEQFLVPIAELEPWPGNARRGDVIAVRASFRRFGQTRSILTYEDNARKIVAGHHVVEAAREEGWTHIAAIPNEFESAAEARAYVLADNRTHDRGGYDDKLLLEQLEESREEAGLEGTGFEDSDVVDLRADLDRQAAEELGKRDLSDLDKTPPKPRRPKSKRGEIYELGPHRLMCGDSRNPDDVVRLLGEEPVPLIFTSPPYGVGLDYSDYDDTLENLRELLVALANVWREHVPAGGYCVTNFGDNFAARGMLQESEPCEFPMALEHWPVFRDAGWLLNTRRIFQKIPTWARDPWTFESNRAAFDWEHLWTWKRPGKGLNARRHPSYLGVWDVGTQTGGAGSEVVSKSVQPASFPITLALWTIGVYSNVGDVVADPFAGSGTVLLAADLLDRRARLMEIDRAYCDVIRRRYEEYAEAKANLAWSADRAA